MKVKVELQIKQEKRKGQKKNLFVIFLLL